MPARYAALPNPRSSPDADREMEEAFGSDDEDGTEETTPLTRDEAPQAAVVHATGNSIPGAYDFEREYDVPPPGSPPLPSTMAQPNDWGNSNGLIPTQPIQPPTPTPSFFRRVVGSVLPTHYARVPTEPSQSGARGGGVENDGVFANVMAKPGRARAVRADDGSVHMVPEEVQKEAPPSYADAQADAAPSYWETTVHAPSGFDLGSDMIIDDLPSGSTFVFIANLFTSFFFQFVGFMLTYVLHTSHAGKYGSRAGLGLTLIQYGFYSRRTDDGSGGSDPSGWTAEPTDTSPLQSSEDSANQASILMGEVSREWLSFLLMTLGWFLLLSSLVGFWRIKHWESSIRASSAAAGPISPEAMERNLAIRRNIERVFGFGGDEESSDVRVARGRVRNEDVPNLNEAELEEARLTRQLRYAGLI